MGGPFLKLQFILYFLEFTYSKAKICIYNFVTKIKDSLLFGSKMFSKIWPKLLKKLCTQSMLLGRKKKNLCTPVTHYVTGG